MKIKAVQRYINQPHGLAFAQGEEMELDEDVIAFLMADSPGSFRRVNGKAMSLPPANKMVASPQRSKHSLDDFVSAAIVKRLKAAGYHSVEDLAAADIGDLKDIKGIGDARARAFITEAQRLING